MLQFSVRAGEEPGHAVGGRESEFSLPAPFTFHSGPQRLDGAHPHGGGRGISFIHLLYSVYRSERQAHPETSSQTHPETIVNQIPGHPVTQSS